MFVGEEGDLTSDPYLGTVIDNTFEVQSILGTGSMGIVYKARHRVLNCDVALKVLRHNYLNDRVIQVRFQREAQAASSLSHPNIIRILHFGRTQLNAPYIAMECLDGLELSSLVPREFPLSPKRVCHIVSQTARALGAAHRANIIHRDLKPANIIVIHPGNEEVVKVLDFGIAKISDIEGEGLTREGAVCGTPAFMSPEQVLGKDVTFLADIFSLGSTMYFMLTCRLPFQGDTLVDMSRSIMTTTPTPPSQARLDCYVAPELEAICLKAMAKDPRDRFSSADEMADALDAIYPALPDNAPNIKPRIVVGTADVGEDLSGKTQYAMDQYDEEDEEGGTVVEMPAYPSSTSSVIATEQGRESGVGAAISQIVSSISSVLPSLSGSPKAPHSAPQTDHVPPPPADMPSSSAELVQQRKRLLLGIVCILVSLCILIVGIIMLVTWITRPEPSPKPVVAVVEETSEPAISHAEQTRLCDLSLHPYSESALLGAIYGIPEVTQAMRNALNAPTDVEPQDTVATDEPSGDEVVKAPSQENTPQKTASPQKTTAKKSSSAKSSAKLSAKKSSSAKSKLSQAMKLESTDKIKACAMYKVILKDPSLSQSDKLKVQAKLRSCSRMTI